MQVRAENSAGDGEWSDAETGTPLPDDIPITLQWEEATLEAEEDAGSIVLRAVFTTTLNAPPAADFTFDVNITTADVSATQNDDYTPPASTAAFAAADFSQADVNGQQRYRATRDFTIDITDETVDETDEVFRVILAYQTPGLTHLQGGPSTAVVTINDNEHVPVTISWDQSDVTVDEDDGSVTLRVFADTTLDKRPKAGFSFDASIYTSNGSAAQPGDYTQVDDTVTFGRNDFDRVTVSGERRYRAVKEIVVDIEDDTIDEIEEDFTATYEYSNPGPPHLQCGPAVARVKIADNEYVPVTINWEDADISVSEDAGSVTLYAQSVTTEDGIPLSDFSFELRVSTNSGSAQQNSDYSALNASETFLHSDFSATVVNGQPRYRAEKQITIDIQDDIYDEGDEDFTVRLAYSNPRLPYLQGGSVAATVTVTNDDEGGPEPPRPRPPPPPAATRCDSSLGTLSGTTARSGSWASECQSSVPGRGYARYYSFTLTGNAEVTIDLTSSVNTYLYLREGSATFGTALHDNDDIESGNTDSRIVATLSAATYTIEATTYSEDATGSFTLSVSTGPNFVTVNVSRAAGGENAMLRPGHPVPLAATFSRPVSGFTVEDIFVVNGSASNFAGSEGDAIYTFEVTPNAIGEVTVDISADAAQDDEGEGNTAAPRFSLGITYDDDEDNEISRAEAIEAIRNYFSGVLTRAQAIAVIRLYIS